jgi:hypothetical protein
MMGETAYVRLGIPFYAYPISVVGSLSLNAEFTPLEAHTILWHIEQSLMRRETGKRWEMEIAEAYGDPFFVALQDYDWADEVLHAQLGRRWLQEPYGSAGARKAAGAALAERWWPVLDRYGEGSSGVDWWPAFVAEARARAGRAA